MLDFVDMGISGYSIVMTQPAPSGWLACYLGDISQEQQEAQILKLPIALWAVVEITDDDGEEHQEVRHFVADPSGEIIDYLDVGYPFLCVVEPGADIEKRARTAVQEHLQQQEENQTDQPIAATSNRLLD